VSGEKTKYDATYLTARRPYRNNITVRDFDPTSATINADIDALSIADVRLDLDLSTTIGRGLDKTDRTFEPQRATRGSNAQLALYVHLDKSGAAGDSVELVVNDLLDTNDTRIHADIYVYQWDEPETDQRDFVANLNGQTALTTADVTPTWVLVHQQSVLTNTQIMLTDLAAGRYRVAVGFITDSAVVEIIEQHSE
jgi:hypothetical protein